MEKGYKESINKISYSDLPYGAITQVAIRMKEFSKYPRGNYLKPLKNTLLIDAALRHIIEYLNGNDLDTTTSHLTAAVCNLLILEEQRLNNTLIEDRLSKEVNNESN